jgi:hypothetical protein
VRESEAASAADGERAFCAFATLWSVAILLDQAQVLSPASSLGFLLLVLLGRVAAVSVLTRPSGIWAFLVLNAALVATIFTRLPKAPNHGVLALLVAATILVCALRIGVIRCSGSELYRSFAPLLRWQLVALYFWAVVQKLNGDFFDAELSCGPAQVWNLRRMIPILPVVSWLEPFSIYGTLLVEASIPCLLLARRTRILGIALGAGFHLVIGAGYVGFSAMLFALLALFAPPEFHTALWKLGAASTARLRSLRAAPSPALRSFLDRSLRAAAIVLAAGAALAFLAFSDNRAGFWGPALLGADRLLTLWFAFGALVIGVFTVVAWRAQSWIGERGVLRLRYRALAVMPLLVFGLGLSPHLGLKNTQSFAMFSNLETGGGTSNHLFIPSSWQIFDHLSDLVTIRDSNDRVLQKLVGPSWKWFNYFSTYTVDRGALKRSQPEPTWRLPYIALRRRVSELAKAGRRDVRLVYERGGVTHRLERAETHPELSSLSTLANKLLLMRAVPDADRGYCLW